MIFVIVNFIDLKQIALIFEVCEKKFSWIDALREIHKNLLPSEVSCVMGLHLTT